VASYVDVRTYIMLENKMLGKIFGYEKGRVIK
jgi:hypothetical protein